MTKKLSFRDLIGIIADWVWCEIVDPHLIPIYENGQYTGEIKQAWDFYVLYYLLQMPLNIIRNFHWRIFIRGKCALKGCKIVYFDNWNLPDDCHEWMCENCGSEGINFQVDTIEPFYNNTPIQNFIQALRGN